MCRLDLTPQNGPEYERRKDALTKLRFRGSEPGGFSQHAADLLQGSKPTSSADDVGRLLRQASFLRQKYQLSGDVEALKKSHDAFRSAAGRHSLSEEQRSAAFAGWALTAAQTARLEGTSYAWNMALLICRRALIDGGVTGVLRPLVHQAISQVYAAQYLARGYSLLITAAIRHAQQGIPGFNGETFVHLYGPVKPFDGVHNLVTVLRQDRRPASDSLAEAVSIARRALDAPEELYQGQQVENLRWHGASLGIYEAAAMFMQAMGTSSIPQQDRFRAQALLGETLHDMYLRSGDPAELDDSIRLLRASRGGVTDQREANTLSYKLAEALRSRYELYSDQATLEEAVALGRKAVAACDATELMLPLARVGLAATLLSHYRRTRQPESVAEAIDLCRTVVDRTPARHLDLASRLSVLSRALLTRYDHTGETRDLQAATTCARQAVAAAGGSVDRSRLLDELSVVSLRAYRVDRDPALLDTAVEAAQEAVESTDGKAPVRALRLMHLAQALSERHDQLGDRESGLEAIQIAESACEPTLNCPPSQALFAASTWGSIAARQARWDDAARAFGKAVELIPRAAPRNLTRADLEHLLSDVSDLAGDAVAATLEAGDTETALIRLEQGRARLLAYALDTRADLAKLNTTHPGLVRDWLRLRDQLDGVTSTAEAGLHPDQRLRLQNEWDDLLSNIRKVDEFEQFMEQFSLDDLRAVVAGRDAVVSINASELRCDAVLLTADGVRCVPLTGVTTRDVTKRLEAFLAATAPSDNEGDGDPLRRSAEVQETLTWLWDCVVEPVLDALGHTTPPQSSDAWPRVWWSPTGPFALFPLHAAGRPHDVHRATTSRVVSSYTPSIEALRHVRDHPATIPASERRVLSVAVPNAVGAPLLHQARAEAELVAEVTDGAAPLTSHQATRNAVLAALPWATWTHLACHASADPAAPSDSGLLLHDGLLSVAEISELRLRNVELVYLSACSTARSARHLTNEAIHLASAFQLAGYKNVIATLWPVQDGFARPMAEAVYRELMRGCDPATALHRVIRHMRADLPNLSVLWAAYVHVGA